MAPGGIEPPHAASKAAALSAELRGRARKSVSLDSLRCSAPAVAVAQLVELRVVVPVVAGSSPVRHPSSQARLERERHARARNGSGKARKGSVLSDLDRLEDPVDGVVEGGRDEGCG